MAIVDQGIRPIGVLHRTAPDNSLIAQAPADSSRLEGEPRNKELVLHPIEGVIA